MFTMTGRIGLLLLLLFVNADAASTQQERKLGPANVALPVARPSSSVPAANMVGGANVPMVQNVPIANVVGGANVPMVQNVAPVQNLPQMQFIPMMQNAQLMQNVPMIQNLAVMQNVPMMANMANVGQQRQLVPLGTVNIPNLGNVPVYGVPVSVNQAGQLQIGTGLNLTGLNLGGLNLGNALGVSSSGVARQMSAVSVLSVVVANLWYHRSC
ncbi:unnamed protein product [Arctogadus glacialis]